MLEAEKYLGYPYVWADRARPHPLTAQGMYQAVVNHSGCDFGRLTADGEAFCISVCRSRRRTQSPADLIFFQGNTTPAAQAMWGPMWATFER